MTTETTASPAEDSTELRMLVQKIKDLPTIPSVLMKLLALSVDSSTNADNLAEIIGIDQTISAKLLRLSNSAFYGCRGKVTSIPRAIMILGFNEVKSLALGMSVFNAFSKAKGGKKGINIENLWKHSIATAALSKFLAGKISDEKPDSIFTAGLLHDIGKVVFLNSFQEEYKRVGEIVAETGGPISDGEIKVFGADHHIIGEWLCKKWKMPEEIRQCVRYHSNPSGAKEEFRHCVDVVHVANAIAGKILVGYSGDELTPEPESETLERLGVDDNILEEGEVFIEGEREGIESMI